MLIYVLLLGRGSFSINPASVRCGMEAISLWHYWAFSSSVLLDRLFLIFLLKISHRFHRGFRPGTLAGQSSTVISWSANHLEVLLALWAGAKWKHKVLQNILVLATLTLDLIKHNGPTPADVTAPQIINDFGNFTLDFVSSSRLWDLISKLNAKFTFIWKDDFGPLSNSPVMFLLSPGKMLLTLFLFQKWLGSSFPEDVWVWWLLIHWLQLQFTPCEALPSVWIGFARPYSQACGHPCYCGFKEQQFLVFYWNLNLNILIFLDTGIFDFHEL